MTADSLGPLGLYRSLLELSDGKAEDFVVAVLDFDPFPHLALCGDKGTALGCAMLDRLLKRALEISGGGEPEADEADGWGELDLDLDGAAKETGPNVSRLRCQLRRLQVLRSLDGIRWTEFRDMEEDALCTLACKLAARQCIPALETLCQQEGPIIASHWQKILSALPETAEIATIKQLLPVDEGSQAQALLRVPDATNWFVERAFTIVERTGLCRLALELLEYRIHSEQGIPLPEEGSLPLAAGLPPMTSAQTPLYETFRLCGEYQLYLEASHQEMLESGWPLEEPPPLQSLVTLRSFQGLTAPERARLLLRSSAETVVEDVKAWKRLAVTGEVEETLTEALLGRLGSTGWEPGHFKMMAAVVQGSSPALPRPDRIIKDPELLMDFIFRAVYSEDQRCHAADILQSVDIMYGCIPKPDTAGSNDEKWAQFQKQADELDKHLTCLELLLKHKIKLSLSFADLHNGCSNENMAWHSMWNLFRVLGARYRPALFWRGFQQELFYLHSHAFAAVPLNAVYDMFVRCLVDQEHLEVMNSVVESWTTCCPEAFASLVALAQELVNCSPALRHPVLEKASRLLRAGAAHGLAASGAAADAAAEADFIKACELLHDLLHRKPKRTLRWVQSAVQDITSGHALAQLSQEMRNIRKKESAPTVASEGLGFAVETPVQLRLQWHQPVRLVTDLLEFNPPILLESEDLQKFCSLLELSPSSASWAEVMALCGAAHLLCGERQEALTITEKLLVNRHPAAWKLAAALHAEEATAAGEALLADAARVCAPEDLPRLLSYCQEPAMSAEPLFSLDLGLSPDADVGAVGAWDAADVSAAAAALVEAAEASSPSPEIRGAAALLKANSEEAWDARGELVDGQLTECPETEPDRGSHAAAFRALREVCPDLDGGEDLAQQLLRHAASEPLCAPALARAVCGVQELAAAGITPSKLALAAAKGAASEDLHLLVHWLDPSDGLQLLTSTLDQRARCLEVIAHLRLIEELQEPLRQAEALILLRSSFQGDLPLELHPEKPMEEVKGIWLAQLEEADLDSFVGLAEALLETGF